VSTNYRFDPYSDSVEALTVTDEIYVIPSVTPYEIKLLEVPENASPSSMSMRIVDMLSAAISTTSATSITVTNGDWFTVGKTITINSEQLYVSAISDSTLTVTRGYNSTTASVHSSGDYVFIEDSMAEVSSTPTSGQFWPDYSCTVTDDSNWNTGTIVFNSGDAGKWIAVSYSGLGTLVDDRFMEFKYPPWLYNFGTGENGSFNSTADTTMGGEYNYTNFVLLSEHTITLSSNYLVIRCTGTAVIGGTIYGLGKGGAGVTSGSGTIGFCAGSGGGGVGTTVGGVGGATYIQYPLVAASGGSLNGSTGHSSSSDGATPSSANIIRFLQMGIYPYGAAGGAGAATTATSGGGGGCVIIIAKQIIFTGTINCNGAAGGSNSTNNIVAGSGGGGVAILAGNTIANSGTITVAGGAYTTYSSWSGGAGGAGWYKVLTLV